MYNTPQWILDSFSKMNTPDSCSDELLSWVSMVTPKFKKTLPQVIDFLKFGNVENVSEQNYVLLLAWLYTNKERIYTHFEYDMDVIFYEFFSRWIISVKDTEVYNHFKNDGDEKFIFLKRSYDNSTNITFQCLGEDIDE